MRRKDREVRGMTNLCAILDKCDVMRVGLCADDKPYIVPMNFAYEMKEDNLYIYFHCALSGKKLDIIDKNDNACFETDCDYKTLRGETACKWSAEYQSVYGEGKIDRITDSVQKTSALDLIMKRYGFEGAPLYTDNEINSVAVLRISVKYVTGKSNIKHDETV